MASTNKTTHYELSQYIGTDKPTYLVDYNGDMSKIDTGIYNAQGKADTNESAIGTLSSLNTTVKTDLVSAINEVKGNADKVGNLSNLTTTAKTDLVVAVNEVDAEADANTSAIGTIANLETTNKTDLVAAVNEVNGNVGTLSNLTTTNKNNLVSAINEVNDKTNFHTTETVIGYSEDNKPVYRKLFTGTLSNNDVLASDVAKYYGVNGFAVIISGTGNSMPYYEYSPSGVYEATVNFSIASQQLRFVAYSAGQALSNVVVEFYIEYTKSTD